MIRRLSALAELDDRDEAAAGMRRRAAGGGVDEAWLLAQWERGAVLLARIAVKASVVDPRGAPLDAEHFVEGTWLERDDPPKVEEQVAEAAPACFPDLAEDLRARGAPLGDGDLEQSYLHVELGERLRDALA